ncbi:MAG TPA: DNA polymerase I [Gemmatimonadaceae bacterium]|nr:DNA polymerase I [Gemmatimonadaceae bacterium]
MTTKSGRRLFLVDGYALIYRAFFALGDHQLVSSRGENTTIALGAQDFLRRLLERHHPDAVGWVHDAGLSFRHTVFPAYKATRERLEAAQQADFDTGVARVADILAGYRIPILALDGFEADDVIGTLARQAHDAGVETVIVSGDKDFMQLVGPGVKVLNPWHGRPGATTEKWYDETNAGERLGVAAERVVDYLALLGDTSDNVPGVRGIGDKTARALIERWGPVENMLAHLSELEPARARTALEQHAADAILSKQLVTIRTDLPMRLDLDALEVREPDWPRLRDLFVVLEFRVPAQEAAERADAASGAREGSATPDLSAARAYEVIESTEQLGGVIAAVRAAGAMTMKCMTVLETGAPPATTPMRSRLVGLAIGVGGGRAFYLPFRHRAADAGALALDIGNGDATGPETPVGPRNLPALQDSALVGMRALLEDPAIAKAGHNIKFDLLVLRREGISLRGMTFDSMLASYLLDPGRRSHAIEALAIEFLQRSMPTLDDVTGKGKQRTPLDQVPVAEVANLGASAADVNWELHALLAPRLEGVGAAGLLRDVELPLVSVLAEMEWTGICIDVAWFHSLKARFARERAVAEEAIYTAAGEQFNINSNRQLATILFDRMHLPVRKKTSTGASTDASVLQQLAEEGHELPARILEYREFAKLESTYLDTLPGLVNPATGRLHTSYDQAVAATGRLSSSDPNLQNIPIRRELGRDIRRGFIPRAGWKLLAADYSQVELRLLAHLSDDRGFVDAFIAGGDIHRQTASIIFGVPVDAVTSEMRARAKTINFATIYGQGAHALSQQLRIEHAEAKAFIETYFARFAGVRAFLDSTVQSARERGYVETILGRRRYIPELKDRNFNIRAFGERTAQNSPIQGSAADLIKVAMLRVAEAMRAAGLEARMLLQVHDELVFEAPPAEIDVLTGVVRTAMTTAVRLKVPLVVDIGIGDNWVEAKA